MEKSPTISELAKALNQFQSKSKTIGYDASNPFFKSKYATLATLVSSTREELTKEGLSVTQLCEDEGAVTTMLIHTSGEFISSKLTLKPVKDDPQGRGSCLTYSRRYAYAAILGLVSDDDDDANAASIPPKKKEYIKPPEGVKSMKEFCKDFWAEKYGSLDKFNAWLVDNGVENFDGLKELEYAVIFNKIKAIKKNA